MITVKLSGKILPIILTITILSIGSISFALQSFSGIIISVGCGAFSLKYLSYRFSIYCHISGNAGGIMYSSIYLSVTLLLLFLEWNSLNTSK